MSETGEDSGYFAAAEAAFIRRRGTPFLLSPRDFALLAEWRALGVPVEAIEQGIDDAFSRREERGAAGRVNSLSYCRDAVLGAWERRAEAAIGRGTGRTVQEGNPAASLAALAARLTELADARPDLEAPLASAARSVSRLAASGKDPAAAEDALARLDKRLAGSLYDALPEAERGRVDGDVADQLARARVRLDEETAGKTARALRRRAVREALGVPRLSLL
ncbi:MAG: hypothetical protein LC796_09465 [Acidobacteria bacterium]|nr:hypothetical protein [Acidobacteriota bacterium]MCA1610550.1 hypothetical protein [Acidobacteriota bacterium]